jgi:3-oxoacyl-[acyl-carrier-protein] synthase II
MAKEEILSRVRVVVTGMGCISPLGNDVSDSWDALLNAESGVGPITLFDATEYKTRFAAEVKDFDPLVHIGRREARRMDRFAQFCLVATEQALVNSGFHITDANRDRVGVVIGTGIGGMGSMLGEAEKFYKLNTLRVSPFMVPMMLPDAACAQVAIRHGARGPNMAVVTACASGNNAIGEAAELIRRGAADVVIAGGAEAAIIPIAVASFNVMNAISTRNDDPTRASRPFDLNRDGFVIGEGAATLILESYEHAHARSAPILAEIVGYGFTNDAYHISAPAENGIGAAICMQNALAEAGLKPERIDYINAHGTSTFLNDSSETQAIKTVFGEHAYSTPVSSTKSATGHLLGGAGAIEAVFCIQALNESMIPATLNYETPDPECDLDYVPNQPRAADLNYVMTNSFGFGGHNATLIFGGTESDG